MDDTITIGQKIGFAMVIVFVLALSSSPFLSTSQASNGESSSNDGNLSEQRDVAIH